MIDPSTVQIIGTIIGSGALFSFVQFLIQRRDNKTSKVEKLCKTVDEKYDNLQKELRDGLEEREQKGLERYTEHKEQIAKLNEAILQLTENDTKQSQYMKYIGEELMGLAHDKLVSLTDHYQLRGAITLKEKATLEAIYKPYHEGLGGNGDGSQGYKFCMALPVVTDTQAYEMDKQLK